MFTRKITGQFKKDFKKIRNNHTLITEFEKIVDMIANREKLPEKYNDHKLK
jgi:addiction module RelE/StbE family toxin